MPAHWWVELGLGSLVSRAMSRGMSRGSCGLRKSLGSLSVDAWSCVLALLVGWPEVSQHWSLQAVRWGLVLVPKCWLQETSCQCILPDTSASSVVVPTVSHSHPPPPQETLEGHQVCLV